MKLGEFKAALSVTKLTPQRKKGTDFLTAIITSGSGLKRDNLFKVTMHQDTYDWIKKAGSKSDDLVIGFRQLEDDQFETKLRIWNAANSTYEEVDEI